MGVIGALVEYASGQFGSFVRSNADSYSNDKCARCGRVIGYGGMAKRKGDAKIVHFLRDMNRWGFVLDCQDGGQHFQTEHLGFDAPKVDEPVRAEGQFELRVTQGGSEYDSDDVKAARVSRTEVFNSFDELKRYATDVEGVPMEAFTYRVAGRLNTSYTFQGWNWAWSAMPALEVTLVDNAKPYTLPKLRVSTQVFRVSGSPDIEGWRGRVRNPSFDHMISDYGQDARCCDRATVIGRHMHLSARASVIASKRYYGVAEPAQKLAVRIGDCVTVDGADWIITNVDSLDDPYLLPA